MIMIVNKWILLGLNIIVVVLGYLGTVDWTTYLPSKAGAIVSTIALVKGILALLMPPTSQSTITSTGGTLVTHT